MNKITGQTFSDLMSLLLVTQNGHHGSVTSRAKKSKNTVFLDPADDAALKEIERATSLERGPVSRAAIHGVAEYWRRHKSLSLPLVMIPESEYLELIALRKSKSDKAALSAALESAYSSGKKKPL